MRLFAILAALCLLTATTAWAVDEKDAEEALRALEETQRELDRAYPESPRPLDRATPTTQREVAPPETRREPDRADDRVSTVRETPQDQLASPRHIDPRVGWSIVPPPGFSLVRTGKKTIWRGPDDLEVLVETEHNPRGTAISDWIDLSRRYARAYGRRYRLLQISESALAGHPGAVWEFIKDGRHKLDVATHFGNVGYAVMVSGPARNFDRDRALLEQTIDTFRLPLVNARTPASAR